MSSSPPDDEALRRLFQEATPDADAEGDSGEIWDAVSGAASPEALRATLARVRGSAVLRQEWLLAQALHAELSEDTTAQAPSQQRPTRRIMAAAILLMAAAAVLVMRTPEAPRWRADAEAVLIASTLPGDTLSRSLPLLTWTDLGPQTTYTVTLTDDQLRAVAHTPGLTIPQWRIPEDDLRDLPIGAVLLWRVEATLEDGTHRASATLTLELTP
jgi:hypothetical protein